MHNLSAIKSQFSIFGSDHTSVKDKWIGKYSRKFVVDLVAYMDPIYWSVRSSIRRAGDGVKTDGIVILASREYPFIREY